MGVVDDFKGASIICKVAFALLLVASMFTLISYTTTEWAYDSKEAGGNLFYGLWRICSNDELPTGCQTLDGWANDWYGVVQAFVTFGFFGILVSFALVVLYIFVGKCQKNNEVAFAVAIICIATGIFYFIGVIVFAAEVNDEWTESANVEYKFGYSFALSIIAFILEIVAGILMIVEGKGGGGGGGSTKPSA